MDDFNSARAEGPQDLAGKGSRENTLFRHFPAESGKVRDSGGASLPSGSKLPGIPEKPVSGHMSQNAGKGSETGRSRFQELSDYCVVRDQKSPESDPFPGPAGLGKVTEILSVLFGAGSGKGKDPWPDPGQLPW